MAVKLTNQRGVAAHMSPVGDINVTPRVDIMLVLLIVFNGGGTVDNRRRQVEPADH